MIEIELPYLLYEACLETCDQSLPAYSILIDGVVERLRRDGRTERVIRIPCDLDEAKILLAHAERACPDAVPLIKAAIR